MLSSEIDTGVVSLRDDFSALDMNLWNPIVPRILNVFGPRKLGFNPGMLEAILCEKPDIVHCHAIWAYQARACWLWHNRNRAPYMVSPHGMLDPVDLAKSPLKKRFVSYLFQDAHLDNAACMHALCAAEAHAIRKYGLKGNICIIPNGVNLPEEVNRKRFPERKSILYLGRITPKKGLVNLIRGWAVLKSDNLDLIKEWRLEIAGWDQYGHEAQLKELVKTLGCEDSVHFLGAVHGQRKEDVYKASTAFVLPSTSEGLPLVVLEAWAYSLPVLMTPQCNIPEGFSKDAAIRIESDQKQIACGITKLIEMSTAERVDMGARGRRMVENGYSWPMVAKNMKSVYDWMLGGGEKPACILAEAGSICSY